MGTWGYGVFENDDASDFMYDFVESDPIEYMKNAFGKSSSEYLEVDEAHKILISAVVLDIAITGTEYSDFYYDECAPLIEKVKGLEVHALVPSALKALDRVLSDASELYELWEESDSFSDWNQVIMAIRTRLSELQAK